MGYMRHHAIIVTSWDDSRIEAAHEIATRLGFDVTPIIDGKTNHYRSFLCGPDGSKEGWGDSEEGDTRRTSFVAWLTNDAGYVDWIEVQYGDEYGDQHVVRASNLEDEATR